MAQPKSSYTFSATDRDIDFPRIADENPDSPVIVLSCKDCPAATFVRAYGPANRALIDAGHVQRGYFRSRTRNATYAIYEGDLHGIALGLRQAKVEAY